MNSVAGGIAFFFWAMVSHFLSQVLVDRFCAYADRRAEREPDQSPVASRDRVDHVVTDDDSTMLQSLRQNILFAILLAPFQWAIWDFDAAPEEKGFALAWTWAVRLIHPLLVLRSLQLALRYLRRHLRRMQVRRKLQAERREWDPDGKFRLVFIIHRDISLEAVELFDRITLACYRKGIAVMQYSDLPWPAYSQFHVSTTGNEWTVPNENPQVVRHAFAVVWLDIDSHSKATEAELAQAREHKKPLLRVVRSSPPGSRGYVIEGDGHSVHEPDAESMASRLASWLAEIVPNPQAELPIEEPATETVPGLS